MGNGKLLATQERAVLPVEKKRDFFTKGVDKLQGMGYILCVL